VAKKRPRISIRPFRTGWGTGHYLISSTEGYVDRYDNAKNHAGVDNIPFVPAPRWLLLFRRVAAIGRYTAPFPLAEPWAPMLDNDSRYGGNEWQPRRSVGASESAGTAERRPNLAGSASTVAVPFF